MAHVSLKNIQKSFGKQEILRNISLDIESNEFVAFVGPSGCGKSTLLRTIAGLEKANGGEIYIEEQKINDVPPSKRGISMVFQSYALYPHMNVRKNMSFGLKLAGMDKKQMNKKVEDAAKTLQLDKLLDRKPKQLSGGQRQRVAIGRAIVRDPKVFLFDEPLSNLDASLRVQMRMELAKLHKQLDATMIYVTHDQVEAMTLADRVVVLNNGVIEQCDRPLELYHRPKNRFVASFIGSPKMNFFPAKLIRTSSNEARIQLVDENYEIAIPLTENHNLKEGESMTLGIRPEHIESNPNSKPSLACKVLAIERLGNTSLAHLQMNSGNMLVVELEGNHPVKDGELLPLSFPSNLCHYFNSQGEAIR